MRVAENFLLVQRQEYFVGQRGGGRGRQGDIAENDADLAALQVPGAGVSKCGLPGPDEELKHRIEFALQRRILDEAAAIREYRVGRAGDGALDSLRIQQPAARRHRAAGIAALFDQAPEFRE